MTFKPLLVTALVLALATGATSAQAADAPTADSRLDTALADYDMGHWQQAWATLASLADDGMPEAARIASLMRRHGTLLYRMSFPATTEQVQRWFSLASCGATEAGLCRAVTP